MDGLTVYFDGSCWPNPNGVAAAGVYVKDGSDILLQEGFYVGTGETMSCNVAEYSGLARGLDFLKQKGFTDRKIVVRGDSKMVIKQMSGKWKIKKGLYVEAAVKAMLLAEQFANISFEWIPRWQNEICDELAEKYQKSASLA